MEPKEDPRASTSGPDSLALATLEEQAANLERVRHQLETTLGWAEKRIEFYTSVDAAVQLAIAEALRHAAQIKADTERDAQLLLEKVAAEKAALAEEVASLRKERAALEREIVSVRREAEREAAEVLDRARNEAADLLAGAQERREAILGEIASLEEQFSEINLRVSRFLGRGPKSGSADGLSGA